MSSNLIVGARVICGLVAGGVGLNGCIRPTTPNPIPDRASVAAAAREGLAAGVLCGFQVLAADIAWLQMWSQWERHDWPATETRIRVACALEPRSLYFWVNGARIMAYDVSSWSNDGRVTTLVRRTQAKAALEFLRAAEPFHRQDPQLWIERAGLELYGRGDRAAAAACYRHAAELPGCPAFAGRLYANLLRRLGRSAEALTWLIEWHPTLDPADAEVVLGRIREIEGELRLPLEKSYPAAAQSVESRRSPSQPLNDGQSFVPSARPHAAILSTAVDAAGRNHPVQSPEGEPGGSGSP